MTACELALLGPDATRFELEVAYVTRGAQLVACDARRQLGVDTHQAEHDDEDAWLTQQRPPSRWARLLEML